MDFYFFGYRTSRGKNFRPGHKASETDCSGRVKHKQRGWMKCERIYLNLSTEITFKHFMLQL